MLVSAVNAPPRPPVAVPVYYLVSCVVGLRGGGRASHHSWRIVIVTRILHASLGVGMKLEGSKRQSKRQRAKGKGSEKALPLPKKEKEGKKRGLIQDRTGDLQIFSLTLLTGGGRVGATFMS